MRIAPLRPMWFLLLAALFMSGCMTAARVFLDLPDEGQARREAEAEREVSMEMLDSIIKALQEGPQLPPPPIEAIDEPDSILKLLPTDRAGVVDWVAATRDGTIRPRPGPPDGDVDSTRVFPFDLYLGRGDGPEAFFPHSVHQDWLACQSCHPRVFRQQDQAAPPEQTHGDRSCGLCHNGLAFPIEACERCHEAATDLPRGRLEPTLGEDYQMTRIAAGLPENSDATVFGDASDYYQPARFPHGTHRVRFQCRACHESPFAMELGTTRWTQVQAHGSEGCGMCHDGNTAFDTGVDDCYRCHTEGDGGIPESG